MPFVIAIDGPAASGKGTIATRLGDAFGLPVLDTGLLYRAVAIAVLEQGKDLADAAAAEAAAQALDLGSLGRPELRARAVAEAASRVAALPQVRAALFQLQRGFAAREPGSVLDGRDIGTVIAPEAQAKLFVTARAEVRAERRWRQRVAEGDPVSLEAVLEDIRRRDARDSARDAAPLTQAPDAVLLDTSDLDISQATDAARRIVEAARARTG
jgi:cytidylate kinase